MLRKSRRSALQRHFQQVDAPFISMLGKSAGSGGLADPPRIPWREPRQDLRDSRPIGSHQNLSARLEKWLMPSHASVMMQEPAPAASNTRVAGL